MTARIPHLRNKQPLPVKDIPVFDGDAFAQALAEMLSKGIVCAPISAIDPIPGRRVSTRYARTI